MTRPPTRLRGTVLGVLGRPFARERDVELLGPRRRGVPIRRAADQEGCKERPCTEPLGHGEKAQHCASVDEVGQYSCDSELVGGWRMAGLTHSSSRTTSVVIVGGGIAGLYCARELARQGGHGVTVLETRQEFGGRIETLDLGPFKAECGPMRFELPMQPLFHTLCKDLGITFERFTGPTDPAEPITSYSLAETEHTPRPDPTTARSPA